MTETIIESIWQERVADMDTAETIETLQVSYSGELDTNHALTGTYNQSLAAFRCTDLSKVHPGTLMEMTYELEQTAYTRNIMVEDVDEEKRASSPLPLKKPRRGRMRNCHCQRI